MLLILSESEEVLVMRRRMGLTQGEVAKMCGVNLNTIVRLEDGEASTIATAGVRARLIDKARFDGAGWAQFGNGKEPWEKAELGEMQS